MSKSRNAYLYLYGTVESITDEYIHLNSDNHGHIDIKYKKLPNNPTKDKCFFVSCHMDLETRAISNCILLDLVYYNPKFDQDVFDEMVRKGTEAWKDVEDPVKWVRDMRGDIDNE